MTLPIPGPAYRILTPRLLLRCWEPEDAERLKAAIDRNKAHLLPWMPWAAAIPEELQVHIERLRTWRGNFDLNQDFEYGVFSRDGAVVLGASGLHTRQGAGIREIGYWIDQDYINTGLATETAAALTKVSVLIDRVEHMEIYCDVENARSAAVPRKLGYTLQGVYPQRESVVGEEETRHENMLWLLRADQFASSPAAKIEIEAYDAAGRRIL